jgi:hypothetical protein
MDIVCSEPAWLCVREGGAQAFCAPGYPDRTAAANRVSEHILQRWMERSRLQPSLN